jgi:hypothetical protein
MVLQMKSRAVKCDMSFQQDELLVVIWFLDVWLLR